MEKIHPIRTYNFVDANGIELFMRLGVVVDENGVRVRNNPDTGFRWCFEGKRIPMPVRTWFNGYPEDTMLLWLKEKGWALRCVVDMKTGKATVYDLPEAPEEHDDTTEFVVFNDETDCAIWIGGDFNKASEVRDACLNRGGVATIYRRMNSKTVFINGTGKYIVDDGENEDYSATMFNDFNEANDAYQSLLIAGYPNPHMYKAVDCGDKEPKPAKETDWIPVSSGEFPEDFKSVQVTYLDSNCATPYCDGMAFRMDNRWYWVGDERLVSYVITAWKPVGEPYKGDAPTKATEPEHTEDEKHLYFVDGNNHDNYGWFTDFNNAKEFYRTLSTNTDSKPHIYKAIEIHI